MTTEKIQREILMDKLLVIIINSGSERSSPLIEQLRTREDLEIHSIAANMLKTEEDLQLAGVQYSDSEALKYMGRSLSFPEIGCASSHNYARSLLALSAIGGVILEDDARICDLADFVTLSRVFLSSQQNNPAVLNLSNSLPLTDTCSGPQENDLFLARRISPTPLAVGYAITSLGAGKLLSNNNPIQYVSDWPAHGVLFFSAGHGLVHHGDSQTQSTIDPAQASKRNVRSYKRALSILFGIHFFRHMIKFGIDFSYFQKVWWMTFSHKVSFLRGFRHYVKR